MASARGREYSDYVRSFVARVGGLPRSADPLLREAGRIVVDLNRWHGELEHMVQVPGGTPNEERGAMFRLERKLAKGRTQLISLERHLTELAKVARSDGPISGEELATAARRRGSRVPWKAASTEPSGEGS